MNKDCLPLFFNYLFNMCIMHLSFWTCICQKHFPHEQISRSPTTSMKCVSFSITSSASHISSERHTHIYPVTKWDRSSIILEIVTKLTLSVHLMITFRLWYTMQHVGTKAGMLTTMYLPLISRKPVTKETIIEDKHINLSLFSIPVLKVETKDVLPQDHVFRSIACLCPHCLLAVPKWPQFLSQLQPAEKFPSQHWNRPNTTVASCGKKEKHTCKALVFLWDFLLCF